MGHRTARRVPMDFDWPWHKVWKGYINPHTFPKCSACDGKGYSPEYAHYHDLWYGNAPFKPEDNGSVPFGPFHPAVVAFAQRNIDHSPEFYGSGLDAVFREAKRLSSIWDTEWCHHLNQADVDVLVANDRLMDFTHKWTTETRWQRIEPPVTPTAAEVNEWSLRGFGHDGSNAWICCRARCKNDGVPYECTVCGGKGYPPEAEAEHALFEAYEWIEPPTGDGWQLWETTSEGSPVSPVFASAEELAEWCETGASAFADMKMSKEDWLAGFLEGTTDIDTLLIVKTPA